MKLEDNQEQHDERIKVAREKLDVQKRKLKINKKILKRW